MSVTPVRGGFTNATRVRLQYADGSKAFLKAAVDEETAGWLDDELAMYDALKGAPFLPKLLDAWTGEGGLPAILLEDLGDARWPGHPWTQGAIDAVLEGLKTLATWPVPGHLEKKPLAREEDKGWSVVAENPEPFLRLGLVARGEFDELLMKLLDAQEALDLGVRELLHGDVRSDNMCLAPDRGLVLVDWNWARSGPGGLDVAFWLPSLALEGGPRPWHVMSDERSLAAVVSGFFCAQAGLPPWPGGEAVRAFQLAQARVALEWVRREI